MKKLVLMAASVLLVLNYSVEAWAKEENPVCTDIGGLMYGGQQTCKKGDVITVNPMAAAFLCDLSLPSISGKNIVVCHFLGKKRPERNPMQ